MVGTTDYRKDISVLNSDRKNVPLAFDAWGRPKAIKDFSIFHGVKSSGKTTHALRIAGAYQEQRPNQSVLLMDFEQSYDHEWTKHFIKDEDRFFVAQPDYGEQGVDMLKEYATADDIGLIIIDSLAMMIPTAEADAQHKILIIYLLYLTQL